MTEITASSQHQSSRIPGNFNVAMNVLEVFEDCIILYLIVDAVLSALVLAKTFNVFLPGSSDDQNLGMWKQKSC